VKNTQERLARLMQGLSLRYDFFYILKKYKKIAFFIGLVYILFVFNIIQNIYSNNGINGIYDNVLPFFVDVGVVFLATAIILLVRAIYNNEKETVVNDIHINYLKPLNYSIDNIEIKFELNNNFYQMPEIISKLLAWLDFNKEDYYRMHYGGLDIPKFSLKTIECNEGRVILELGMCSFYDIVYTHYFPDYIISSSHSTDSAQKLTLRQLLSPNIEEKYSAEFSQKSMNLKLVEYLPNPIGITGIVVFQAIEKNYYLLQIRNMVDVTARKRVQWSFAGTIDVLPNLFKENFNFNDLVMTELSDEVLFQKMFAAKKKKKDENRTFGFYCENLFPEVTCIGFVLNDQYLYQPEFFVKVVYKLNTNQTSFISELNKLESISKKAIETKRELKDKKFLCFSDMEEINKLLLNEEISKRNLFKAGYDFLQKSSKNS